MKLVLRVLCLLLCCHATLAQEKTTSTARSQNTEEANEGSESANPSAAKLPIRRVVLYKNGVGYFEHLGRVRGNESINVDFSTAQLDDVVNSLTVLDLGDGRVNGISYNSEAPVGERLGSLRLAIGDRATLPQ